MVGICDALEWACYEPPHLKLNVEGLKIDGGKLWRLGGRMGAAGNESGVDGSRQRLRTLEAVLAFYSPTGYGDQWWTPPSRFVALKLRG